MKKIICLLLGLVLLLSVISGCGPLDIKEGGADALLSYLSGNGRDEFMLRESIEINITDVAVSSDRTVYLSEGVTLRIYGTIAPGKNALAVRAESDGAKKPVLDLSGLSLADVQPREATLLDVRSDVELIPPAETKALSVDTTNEEWTAIKAVIPAADPQQSPAEDSKAATEAELLGLIADPDVLHIVLTGDITADFGDTALSRNVMVNCAGFALTLKGRLTVDGGILEIEDQSEGKSTRCDLSGLTVLCGNASPAEDTELLFLRLKSSQITGTPGVGDRLSFDTREGGEASSVKVSGPDEGDDPSDNQPQGFCIVSAPAEFLQAFADPEIIHIELEHDISVNFEDASLSRDLDIICAGHVLTLSGELNMHGGVLDIGEIPNGESGTVDVSGLSVTCDFDNYTQDMIFIGIASQYIIGKPKLADNLLYEVPVTGEHASVRLKDATR